MLPVMIYNDIKEMISYHFAWPQIPCCNICIRTSLWVWSYTKYIQSSEDLKSVCAYGNAISFQTSEDWMLEWQGVLTWKQSTSGRRTVVYREEVSLGISCKPLLTWKRVSSDIPYCSKGSCGESRRWVKTVRETNTKTYFTPAPPFSKCLLIKTLLCAP